MTKFFFLIPLLILIPLSAYAQVTLNNVTFFTDTANYTVTNDTTITINKLLVENDGISMRKIAWEEFRKINYDNNSLSVNLDIQDITVDRWLFNLTSTQNNATGFLISTQPEGLQIDLANVAINHTFFLTTIEINNGRLVNIIYTPSVAPIILPNLTLTPVAPLNQTNPNLVSFIFIRTDTNSSNTVLDVQYPLIYDTTCSFYFNLAMVNLEYSNLTTTEIGNGRQQATFNLNSPENDIIDVECIDVHTNDTGRYLITQNDFELLSLIDSFRSTSEFGTQGMFGALDFITLAVIVIAFIGFNRKNEAVGVIIAVFIIGGTAFFGIIQFPTIIAGIIAVLVMLAVVTTRKPG